MRTLLFLLTILISSIPAQAGTLDRKMDALMSDLAIQYNKANPDMVSKAAVSILNLQNRGKDAKNNYIGEALTSILKISVKNSLVFFAVDRENLSGVMKEMELSQTGLLDENSSAKFKGLKGVDCLIVGEVTESGGNFIVTCQLIDIGTAKILAASKTEIEKKVMIKETEKFAYEYISANGIGISCGPLWMIADQVEYRNKFNTYVPQIPKIHATATYRLMKNLKFSLIFNNYALDMVDSTKQSTTTLADAKNITRIKDITNYPIWNKYVIDTNNKGTLAMQPQYYLVPEMMTLGFVASFVLPLSKRMSLSLGAGPQTTWVEYKQHCDNIPHLLNGAVEYITVDVVNRATGVGFLGNLEFEAFILPRLALNVGLNYAFMFSLIRSDTAEVNGVTYYKGTPAMEGGYGALINDLFGYDPFKTFNGNDVYVNVNNLQVFASVSLYF
jgi:TolB-like protein